MSANPIKIRPESAYDPRELAMGVKVEMEHTDSPAVASRIARQHLEENNRYYSYLTAMEKRMKRGLKPNPELVLYHGTNLKVLRDILSGDGVVQPPSYWGTRRMAEYYARGFSDGSSPVVLAIPLSRFSVRWLKPDKKAIAEPILGDQAEVADELLLAWRTSGRAWDDSLEIYESIVYQKPLKITAEDILRERGLAPNPRISNFRGWVDPRGEKKTTADGEDHNDHAERILRKHYKWIDWMNDTRFQDKSGAVYPSLALEEQGWVRVVGPGIYSVWSLEYPDYPGSVRRNLYDLIAALPDDHSVTVDVSEGPRLQRSIRTAKEFMDTYDVTAGNPPVLRTSLTNHELVALFRFYLGGAEAMRTEDYSVDSKTVGALMKKGYFDKRGLTAKGVAQCKDAQRVLGTLPMRPEQLERER